jgi:16S rRNA (uracil1498-N3)-methyltransferase
VVPPVREALELADVLAPESRGIRLMFVEPSAAREGRQDLRSLGSGRPVEAMVLIGPEGGWDAGEVDLAARSGVTLVTFGRRTLRADAAGAAALAVLQFLWDDL